MDELYPLSVNNFEQQHAKLKTFSEITDNDMLYIIDIDNAYDIRRVYHKNQFPDDHSYADNMYKISIEHATYPEHKTYDNYVYDKIKIDVLLVNGKQVTFNTFDNASFAFDWDSDYILCACKNGADIILHLLKAKCNIQALKFKSIFNGKL